MRSGSSTVRRSGPRGRTCRTSPCLARTDTGVPKRVGPHLFPRRPAPARGDRPSARHLGGEIDFNEVFLDRASCPTRNGSARRAKAGAWRGRRSPGNGRWSRARARAGRPHRRRGHRAACCDRRRGARPRARSGRAPAPGRALRRGADPRLDEPAGAGRGRAGGTPGPAASIGKVHQGRLNQSLQMLASDLLGADALAWPPTRERRGRPHSRTRWRGMLRSRANTIEGGTTEVNKNVLGEKVLGLPREPDPWRRVALARDTALMAYDTLLLERRVEWAGWCSTGLKPRVVYQCRRHYAGARARLARARR